MERGRPGGGQQEVGQQIGGDREGVKAMGRRRGTQRGYFTDGYHGMPGWS